MKNIRQTFVYPKIDEKTRMFGLNPSVINHTGDWGAFLPPEELQKRGNIESSACYIEAQQHTIATLQECIYGLLDPNYAARYNALLSNGTEWGGDPIAGAESIRKDGLVKEESMPFGDYIESWWDFHSWKGVSETVCRSEGTRFTQNWKTNYKVVFERNEPVAMKYAKMREWLKSSPMPISVYGVTGSDGNYIPKPKGVGDTHMVQARFIDSHNRIHVRDTYKPFNKVLPENYNPDFGMAWVITKVNPEEKKDSWLVALIKSVLRLNKAKSKVPDVIVNPIVKSPRERLYEAAVSCLGTDASPKDAAPDEVGCADSVNNVYFKAFGEYIENPGILTTSMFAAMVDRADKWVRVTDPEPGNIIISPTGFSTYTDLPIKHGHVGIFGKGGVIMSNSSSTGKFEENYTLDTWVDRYRKKGGYPIYYFKRI